MAGPKSENIVWSDALLDTKQRSLLTGCRGATIWLTGLSGSGKSTVSALLEKRLIEEGLLAYRLDGDNVRFGLNQDLGFSENDRKENIRRIGEVCKLFTDAGVVTIASFISPYQSDRDAAREIFRKDNLPFFEVYVKVPLDVAESRDPKGLYKKARAGNLKGFTGIDAPYEEPPSPELVLSTHEDDLNECVRKCMDMLSKAGIKPPVRMDSVMGAP
eukprot:CAMPEP_0179414238 /NCGR_PEP_ID=MMETSP0799-20121207/5551_1 /TAXON_ID=46947 /ORGANISM="Geminigera cryophila, Strain CCMP2564" /LENGTH=215 /DNA_ID=CAMNT_0021186815 /DNA_START=176 /DNA_END=823 /DNA_ORIENTATION=+